MEEIDYKEAADGAFEVIYELKRKEKSYFLLEEFIDEIRSQWKYGSPAPMWADENFLDYVYRRLHEVRNGDSS